MTMTEGKERFDGILLGLAQQHKGVEDLLDTFFGFLERKTDFFSGAGETAVVKIVTRKLKEFSLVSKRRRIDEEEVAAPSFSKPSTKGPVTPKITEIIDDELETEPTLPMEGAKSNLDSDTKLGNDADVVVDDDDDDKDEESKGKKKPNRGNGSSTDRYMWTQTLSEVEVRVPSAVPFDVKGKDCFVEINKKHLKVGVKGHPLLIDDDFPATVKVEDCFWVIQDKRTIVITLQKVNRMEWWEHLLVSEPKINTKKVEPENSKLEDLDGETRGMVEKMMFDQRQKAAGLPTSDDLKKNEMLQKFMKQHPEMDFSKAKIG